MTKRGNSSMGRHAVRGAALLGLAVASLGVAVLTAVGYVLASFIGLVFAIPLVISTGRRLLDLRRRLAGTWSNVDVPRPYEPEPAPPQPDPDGLYRHDNHLYKKPGWPAYLRRFDWYQHDRATGHDFAFLALDPLVGAVLALLVILSTPFGAVARSWALRVHGRWTAFLLGPAQRPQLRPWRPGVVRRAADALVARCVSLLGLSLLGLALFSVTLVAVLLTFGVGAVFLFPAAVEHSRWLPRHRRVLAGAWSGVPIDDPYSPRPADPERRADGMYEADRQLYRSPVVPRFNRRLHWLFKDPATWRDQLWLLLDPFVGGLLVAVPVALGVAGFGLLFGRAWTAVFGGHWANWWVELLGPADTAVPVGLVLALASLALAPLAVRLNGRWTRFLLKPTEKARLALRVRQLTESRTDATDAQAAEVRRIERDLHDGAQARLIAVGLTLGAIEGLIERDPAAAKALLAQARETSSAALGELRDLVRGIHPPVLAERGLPDAVRALALDSALRVRVDGSLAGRLDAPVESAAYFAVAEFMANAAKHAAARTVHVTLDHDGTALRIRVVDDGIGGADPSAGSGIRGIERRLGTFDGTITIVSPPGGPTEVTMEIPCALSSPRTCTSSGTA